MLIISYLKFTDSQIYNSLLKRRVPKVLLHTIYQLGKKKHNLLWKTRHCTTSKNVHTCSGTGKQSWFSTTKLL